MQITKEMLLQQQAKSRAELEQATTMAIRAEAVLQFTGHLLDAIDSPEPEVAKPVEVQP